MHNGGLLCDRRHSEATPSIKPKLSMPLTRCAIANSGNYGGTHQGSVPTPLFCASSTIILKPGKTPPKAGVNNENDATAINKEEDEETIEHSGKCISIGNGKYEFWDTPSALVGRGSYGIVFRGTQLSRRKPVAVKRMWRMNVRPDELEAMKCVHNENLVSLLDVCLDVNDTISYLVMELCDTDLDRHLKDSSCGHLESADIRVVVESVARGYFALYEKHIVHRDIKPQNILLLYNKFSDKNERRIHNAKITDFGVSRVLADENMGLCNVAGTLLFMAPEVGANLVAVSEYDHRADMWSIGCLFFQCSSGFTPFDEASLCRLFLHCACGNFDGYEVPELPPETEPAFRLLICSLLQIDSVKRPTPRQLLDAAERLS
ncbi:unnamed protein product [Meloidogyne enterolobii]|uniref:Protein kinase domain-containing protein n=2 Tax=Meloidogyne enterolobii TaxID=390850 RepID=A0A6V7X0W4_MELEN|nr:unnamed protein product [Meloidogyne enterolobii]